MLRLSSERFATAALLAMLAAGVAATSAPLPASAGRGTGALVLTGSIEDGVIGVDGLEIATSVAVSPDGLHAYATSREDALLVFSRDAIDGSLAHVETHFDGEDDAEGLGGARDVVVSPDGEHVYVASKDPLGGPSEAAVAVFDRDAVSGSLVFIEEHKTGLGGIPDLDGAENVIVSADGAHVYVAAGQVAIFSRAAATGRLTYVEWIVGPPPGIVGADDLALSPDGAHLYARGGDGMAVWDRDPVSGTIALAQAIFDDTGGVDGLDDHGAVVVSPDGSHVYTTSTDDRSIAAFSRDAGTGELTFLEIHTADSPGVEGMANLSAAADVPLEISADGAHVYLVSDQDDAVVGFGRDPGTGLLTFAGAQIYGIGPVRRLDSPSELAVSPDGAHVYASADASNAVVTFERDAPSGVLTFVDAIADDVAGASGLALSSDGLYAYVPGWFEDAVAVLARDPVSGALLGVVDSEHNGVGGVEGLSGPRRVALSPDGTHVYVGSRRIAAAAGSTATVAVFERSAATGELSFVETTTASAFANPIHSIAVSPDGAHLYTARLGGGEIFERDAGAGTLTLVESGTPIEDDLAISADGANVYGTDVFLDVYSRDPLTGLLTGEQFVNNPRTFVAITADGSRVHAAGGGIGMDTYDRDAGTGLLTLVDSQFDGISGPIATSPDGVQVYAFSAGVLAVLEHDAATGSLVFGQATPDPVTGPGAIVPSPDGSHVYVVRAGTESGDAGGVAFYTRVDACPPAATAGCTTSTRSRGSKLVVKNRSDDSRDQIKWKLGRGGATTLADLGDPVATSHYALCVYDADGVAAQPRLGALAPAAGECFGTKPGIGQPCWKASGSSRVRYSYLDRNPETGLTPDGVSQIKIQEGEEGKGKVQLRGQGARLGLELPLTTPVEVQLHNLETGACWAATYSTTQTNTPDRLKARSD